MAQHILDAINSISKGGSSRLRIGSRRIPHRLNKIEKEALERSERCGFLEVYEWNRPNVENIYEKLCLAKELPVIICKHYQDHSVVSIFKFNQKMEIFIMNTEHSQLIASDIKYAEISFRNRKEAKNFASKISSL
jgi:hypothetical protein